MEKTLTDLPLVDASRTVQRDTERVRRACARGEIRSYQDKTRHWWVDPISLFEWDERQSEREFAATYRTAEMLQGKLQDVRRAVDENRHRAVERFNQRVGAMS